MLFLSNKNPSKRVRQTQFFLLLSFLLLSLSSCGGGGGSGQGPDPLAIDIPIAFVERPIPIDIGGSVESENILEPTKFNGGAALIIRERAGQSANSLNITDRAFGAGAIYDVIDVEVSYDGRRLIFSMRAPQLENVDEADQPTWNIWQYDLDNNQLEQIINDPIVAEEGHDISPVFLPDGRIVFTSNRQVKSRSKLPNEIKPANVSASGVYAATIEIDNEDVEILNLHILDPVEDPNSQNIQQLTFSQGHDLQPTLLQDGRIAFLRYDAFEGRDNLGIYTINGDGSNMSILYGFHSQETGDSTEQTTFIDFRELADNSLIAILQTRESALLGGDIIRINTPEFTDINQPTDDNRGDTSQGQQSLTTTLINLDNPISVDGLYNSVYPFTDGSGNALVGRNLCGLRDPNTPDRVFACSQQNLDNSNLEAAPPNYGIWTFNIANNTIVPSAIAPLGQMFTDAVILESRTPPPLSIANPSIDVGLESEDIAILSIRSVYDTDGAEGIIGTNDTGQTIAQLSDPTQNRIPERPARFIRIIKPVSMPSEDFLDIDNDAFGVSQARGMREIIGYAPIEPDGSVMVNAPADIAFTFDIVDADGDRIAPLHRNTLQLKSGENYQCTGCHTADSESPHGRLDAEPPSASFGATQAGIPFPNTRGFFIAEEIGETMAEVYTRAEGLGRARDLQTSLAYTDNLTDTGIPGLMAEDPINLTYTGIAEAPADADCQMTWEADCRTVINYPTHIQPLWVVSRLDGGGANANQCTLCHSRLDAGGMGQTPDGQLELTDEVGPNSILAVSYQELLTQDLPLIIDPNGDPLSFFVFDGGIELDNNDPPMAILDDMLNDIPTFRAFDQAADNINNVFIQTFTGTVLNVYEDMGVFIPNADGNPIALLSPIDPSFIPDLPSMRASNALNSRFFEVMQNDPVGTVDHRTFMTDDELRMIREWLDIGAQYYNNLFDAPLN
jgi:hypothetical protein